MAGGGSVFGLGSSLKLNLVTYCLIGVIAFTIAFETLTHAAERKLKGTPYLEMLSKVYKEMMIMGFISFGVFMAVQAGGVTASDTLLAFEFAHILIFFSALLFVLSALGFIVLSTQLKRIYEMSAHTTVDQLLTEYSLVRKSKRFHRFRWISGISQLRDMMEFKVVHLYFKKIYDLPHDFNFACYMEECLDHHILELVEVEPSTWLFLVLISFLNMGGNFIVNQITGTNDYDDGDHGSHHYDDSHYYDTHTSESSSSYHRRLGGSDYSGYAGKETHHSDTGMLFYIVCGWLLLIWVMLLYFLARRSELRLLQKIGAVDTIMYEDVLVEMENELEERAEKQKQAGLEFLSLAELQEKVALVKKQLEYEKRMRSENRSRAASTLMGTLNNKSQPGKYKLKNKGNATGFLNRSRAGSAAVPSEGQRLRPKLFGGGGKGHLQRAMHGPFHSMVDEKSSRSGEGVATMNRDQRPLAATDSYMEAVHHIENLHHPENVGFVAGKGNGAPSPSLNHPPKPTSTLPFARKPPRRETPKRSSSLIQTSSSKKVHISSGHEKSVPDAPLTISMKSNEASLKPDPKPLTSANPMPDTETKVESEQDEAALTFPFEADDLLMSSLQHSMKYVPGAKSNSPDPNSSSSEDPRETEHKKAPTSGCEDDESSSTPVSPISKHDAEFFRDFPNRREKSDSVANSSSMDNLLHKLEDSLEEGKGVMHNPLFHSMTNPEPAMWRSPSGSHRGSRRGSVTTRLTQEMRRLSTEMNQRKKILGQQKSPTWSKSISSKFSDRILDDNIYENKTIAAALQRQQTMRTRTATVRGLVSREGSIARFSERSVSQHSSVTKFGSSRMSPKSLTFLDTSVKRSSAAVDVTLSSDISDIYLFRSPKIFHKAIDIYLLLACTYGALYVTNYCIVAQELEYSSVLIHISILFPIILMFPVMGKVVKTSSLLLAVAEIKPEIIAKVIEETIDTQKMAQKIIKKIIQENKSLERKNEATVLGKSDKDDLHSFFEEYSHESAGELTRKEFKYALHCMHVHLSDTRFQRLFKHFDISKNGRLNYHEFSQLVYPEEARRQLELAHKIGSKVTHRTTRNTSSLK